MKAITKSQLKIFLISGFSYVWLISGLVFGLAFWIITFRDAIAQKINHRIFWLLSVFIFPFIAPFVYVLVHEKFLQPSKNHEQAI